MNDHDVQIASCADCGTLTLAAVVEGDGKKRCRDCAALRQLLIDDIRATRRERTREELFVWLVVLAALSPIVWLLARGCH